MLFFFSFVVGACFGSFGFSLFNRIPRDQSMWQRSHCEHCQTTLAWYSLVPILAYLFLRGRCQFCQAKISWSYLGWEVVFGVLFLLIFGKLGPNPMLLFWWALWFLLAVLAIFDSAHLFFPASLLILLYLVLSIGLMLDLNPYAKINLIAYAISFFFLLRFFTSSILGKEGLGEGDVLLIGVLAYLFSLEVLIWVLLASSLSGIALILGREAYQKGSYTKPVAYGFFLIATSFVFWIFL